MVIASIGNTFNSSLHIITQSFIIPVMAVLTIFFIYALINLGILLAQYYKRRQKQFDFRRFIDLFLKESKNGSTAKLLNIVESAKIPRRHKEVLKTLLATDNVSIDFREYVSKIAEKFPVYGVTRHQLYQNKEIITLYIISAQLSMLKQIKKYLNTIFSTARVEIINNFNIGSNPGIAVANEDSISPMVVKFGLDAKYKVVKKNNAILLANKAKIKIKGFSETGNGVVGAFAGVGLANTKNDGRFVQLGELRKIKQPKPVQYFLNSGIDKVMTIEGVPVNEGMIFNTDNKPVKPSPVEGEVVLFVESVNNMFRRLTKIKLFFLSSYII